MYEKAKRKRKRKQDRRELIRTLFWLTLWIFVGLICPITGIVSFEREMERSAMMTATACAPTYEAISTEQALIFTTPDP